MAVKIITNNFTLELCEPVFELDKDRLIKNIE